MWFDGVTMKPREHHRKATMNTLEQVVSDLTKAARVPEIPVTELAPHVRKLLDAANSASTEDCNAALRNLASVLRLENCAHPALLAVACAALVERGGEPDLVFDPLVARLDDLLHAALAFYESCRAARAESQGVELEEEELAGDTASLEQFGTQTAQEMPEHAQAWHGLSPLCSAIIALLGRGPENAQKLLQDHHVMGHLVYLEAVHPEVGRLAQVMDQFGGDEDHEEEEGSPLSLDDSLREMLIAATAPGGSPEETLRLSQAVVEAVVDADPATQTDTLQRMADAIATTDHARASAVAIGCGAIVENGGDPDIAIDPILEHLPETLAEAAVFIDACQERAQQEKAAAGSGEQAGQGEGESEEAEEEDEGNLVDRFGYDVAQELPAQGQAWLALRPMCLGAIAMLSRSPRARQQARGMEELLDRAGYLAGRHDQVSFLYMMLQVLDNEELLVLHPESKRGYRVRISGIADNFQLHLLLADVLIGDPARGLLPGKRPDPRTVAAARDKPVDPRARTAQGSFNLWTWRGLQPDGKLPQEMGDSSNWIWNEGTPSDIPHFEGVRVVLLGPPAYARSWNAGRRFDGMPGELRLEEVLPAEAAEDWLARIARAPRE
jgi:hypothetical protein